MSDVEQHDRFRKHIFNAYYNGKVGSLGIDLNVDGLFDRTETPGSTSEATVLDGVTVSRSIESNTSSRNNFWASKLILSYPVWQGNLSAGGEYSYNHRTDARRAVNTPTTTAPMPTRSRQRQVFPSRPPTPRSTSRQRQPLWSLAAASAWYSPRWVCAMSI